jgi:hypothetical protein
MFGNPAARAGYQKQPIFQKRGPAYTIYLPSDHLFSPWPTYLHLKLTSYRMGYQGETILTQTQFRFIHNWVITSVPLGAGFILAQKMSRV